VASGFKDFRGFSTFRAMLEIFNPRQKAQETAFHLTPRQIPRRSGHRPGKFARMEPRGLVGADRSLTVAFLKGDTTRFLTL
jgi:hypothetical protein